MKKYSNFKQRVFELLEKSKSKQSNKLGIAFDWFMVVLIVLNVFAVIIESFQDISFKFDGILSLFEIISITIFSFEYLLRLWTANLKYSNSKHPYFSFIFSFMAMVDIFAILPFYLPFIISIDLRFLRIIRLFRILRILKLNRYNASISMIGCVLKREKDILLTTGFVAFLLLLMASSIMYYVENEAQPEKFSNIIASFWWAIATLTTVGYGDVYPITTAGKILSGIISFLGVGLVALPTGIISSGFISEMSARRSKDCKKCPHCGKEIE